MADALEIAEILVSHAVRTHGAEVAIIAYYGSRARGPASPTSDLDIFYIPDEGKARSLSSQFVLDGLPYDFWSVSWTLAEDIANARSTRPWAVSASIIADAKVLYHRSQGDLDRLNGLKAQIAELTGPQGRSVMVSRALEEFRATLCQLGQVRLAVDCGDDQGLRWAGWKLSVSAVNCLALVNQTYFTKGWGANLSQVLEMRQKPAGLEGMLRAIVGPGEPAAILEQADNLAKEVRRVLLAAQASLAEPSDAKEVFKDFYFYVVEYLAKVVSACDRGDLMAAKSAAFHLQVEICWLMNKVEPGFYGTEFNLLGEYAATYERAGFPDLFECASRGDLAALARQAQELDERAREWFREHSVELNVLQGEEDLRRFLDRRDPA